MKQVSRKLVVPLFGSAAQEETKKWCEGTRAASITGHFSMCHGLVKKSYGALAPEAEDHRRD